MATRITITEPGKTVTVTAATASSTLRAPPQGGIFEGSNPTVWNSSSPIILFIIQAGIIIVFCRLLHWPLSKIRQPRVIAEVIGGVLLGPSVMGRIPGFQETIFPTSSIPSLSLVANLGLVLFLFLVGLEVDFRFLVKNWPVALSVGFAGMVLPFGLGAAIGWGLYRDFGNEPGTAPVSFGVYLLFIGVAMAITAFPVLCRILTELKLLGTPVGVIVLSAGVANDVVGWILLALCVTLVNAKSGLATLWIFLTAIGYTLFLVFIFRPLFMRILRRTRALQDGPSQSIVALTLLVALTSAFFTGVIGIHPIFGAFMAGLICPHDGGFAIKVTEKVEDLVTALFLPLYFALSGLSTDLGLLNSGLIWGYVVGIIAVAFIAKIAGGSGAARLNGLVWRECFTIGALMSCKGLVELIVLNIGLQAGILSKPTFTMFVVMALVTTFATTPIVSALYPPWYQRKLEAWKRGEIDWDTGLPTRQDGADDDRSLTKVETSRLQRFVVYLRLDGMPSLLSFISLLEGARTTPSVPSSVKEGSVASSNEKDKKPTMTEPSATVVGNERGIEVHGLRLLELTERVSSVMKVSEVDESSLFDPVVNTFRTFGRLQDVAVSGEVAIVPQNLYAETLVTAASVMSADLLIIPWSETGSMSEFQVTSQHMTGDKMDSGPYHEFAAMALTQAAEDTTKVNTAIFVNNGFGGTTHAAKPQQQQSLSRTFSGFSAVSAFTGRATLDPVRASLQRPRRHHIFMPFLGGPDDRLALRFVLQLAQHRDVKATVVRFTTRQTASSPTVTEDEDTAFFDTLNSSLPSSLSSRVTFTTTTRLSGSNNEKSGSSSDARDGFTNTVVEFVKGQAAARPENSGDLIVLGRNRSVEVESTTSSCLGALGEGLMAAGIEASLLVMQAAPVAVPSGDAALETS